MIGGNIHLNQAVWKSSTFVWQLKLTQVSKYNEAHQVTTDHSSASVLGGIVSECMIWDFGSIGNADEVWLPCFDTIKSNGPDEILTYNYA